MKKQLVIGITGASGSIYAKNLLEKLIVLSDQIKKTGVIISESAKDVWKHEIGNEDYGNYPFDYYNHKDFNAPFASGSASYDTLIVCPCSMGTLGRIANGTSEDLITRTADVMLKERKTLILVVRETPLNLIQINNMKSITEAGGIICPASPSYYSKPSSFEELAATVINRVLSISDLRIDSYSWGAETNC